MGFSNDRNVLATPSVIARVAFTLAALGVAPAAMAGITEPRETPVTADGKTVWTQDVYGTDETITVRTTSASSCTMYDAGGFAVASFTTRAESGSYVARYTVQLDDAIGTWDVTCGAETVSFVVDDVHGRLWLDERGFDGIVDDYVTAGGPKAKAVPPLGVDPYFVNNIGWQYLLYQAVPSYSMGFAQKTPRSDGTVDSFATEEPYESLYYSNAMAYGYALQRMAFAAQTMDTKLDDPTAPADTAEQNADEYLKASIYWADYLVSIPDWRNPTLPNAYKDGSGLLMYCGSGTCYSKDSRGGTYANYNYKTPLTTYFDDMERGSLLMGLAAAYDWLHEDIEPWRRRMWRDKLVKEILAYRTDHGMPTNWAGFSEETLESFTTNGHTWIQHGSFGVATWALHEELGQSASTRDQWIDEVDHSFDLALKYLGNDGSDHNGVGYFEYNFEQMMRYVEAARSVGGDASFYDDPWMYFTSKWFTHMTMPNDQRVNIGDSEYGDRSSTAFLFARVADETHSFLGQRVAWEGHNEWSFRDRSERRDVLDIAWWNEDLEPLYDIEQIEDDACFPKYGQVSVRDDWSEDATHLAYRGGKITGIHDHPDVGSFTLYKNGHLVSDDGTNLISKRTAIHSTLLVDGKGQHGDGADMMPFEPEGAGTNNAYLFAYLDNSHNKMDLDVVSWGTDMTQLYRLDATDMPGVNATNVEVGKSLSELSRYMVWLGDAVLVLDRWSGTGSFKIDWNLNTSKVQDLDGDGVEDSGMPDACPVQVGSKWGYYKYWDVNGAAVDVAMSGDYLRYGSGSATNDFSKINTNALAPARDWNFWNYSCEDHLTVPSTGLGRASVKAPASLGGAMDIVPLETSPLKWEKRASTLEDGGKIFGYHLTRAQTAASGVLTTALLPYTQGQEPAKVSSANVTGGQQILVSLPTGHQATVLFAKPGAATVSGTGANVNGRLGVVVKDSAGKLSVAQFQNGFSVNQGGVIRGKTSKRSDLGLTWENDSVWGSFDTPTSTTLSIATTNFTPSQVTRVLVNGVSKSFTRTTTGVSLVVSGQGSIVVESNVSGSNGAQGPGSLCK